MSHRTFHPPQRSAQPSDKAGAHGSAPPLPPDALPPEALPPWPPAVPPLLVVPPADELHKVLTQTRVAYPPAVRHTFRHLCQGRTYWLEAHAWRGEQWDDTKRTVRLREGEKLFSNDDVDQAVLRTYRGLLAELSGTVRGQVIRVDRRRIGELTVWIGEEMIDWSQPVTLNVGGRTEFAGRLEPDLGVCLMQAARTWDFDRLRWAGLRFRSGANTRLVSMETEFSDPFSAATAKR